MDSFRYTPELAADWKNLYSGEFANTYLSKRIAIAMNESQLICKSWLVTEMRKARMNPKNVALLGGWFAQYTLPLLYDNFEGIDNVTNYEMDPDTKRVSYKFNKRYKDTKQYKIEVQNVMFDPLKYASDTVINTSCEHMYDMSKFREINVTKDWDRTYVLQSTNADQYEDHINCVQHEDELAEQANLISILYSGSKTLPNGIKRFMVIGK
jgi:hypothetical protein